MSKYWPEFAAQGKQDVTVSELLSHQAGLSHFDEGSIPTEKTADPSFHELLARQKPKWKLGEGTHGYHTHSVGLFVNELVKRADPKQRNLRQYFKEEVNGPLGNLKIYFGLEEAKMDEQIVRHYYPRNPSANEEMKLAMMDENSLPRRAYSTYSDFHAFRSRTMLSPSSILYSTSKDLALLASLTCMYTDPKLVESASEPITKGKDLNLLEEVTFTRGGFIVDNQHPLSFFHYGHGGAAFVVLPKLKIGFSFVCNNLTDRREELVKSFYNCLKLNSNL